jgi:hypothetical protein
MKSNRRAAARATHNALKAHHIALSLGEHVGVFCAQRGAVKLTRNHICIVTVRFIRQVRQRVECANDEQLLLVEHGVQLGHADRRRSRILQHTHTHRTRYQTSQRAQEQSKRTTKSGTRLFIVGRVRSAEEVKEFSKLRISV